MHGTLVFHIEFLYFITMQYEYTTVFDRGGTNFQEHAITLESNLIQSPQKEFRRFTYYREITINAT